MKGRGETKDSVSQHLTKQTIEAYHAGLLSADQLLGAYDHIAQCDRCRKQLGETLQPGATLNNWKIGLAGSRPEHLEYEQLAAYVDKKLEIIECEIVESHINICAQCSQEAHDLMAFSAQFTPPLIDEPTTRPAVLSAPRKPIAESDFWESMVAYWRTSKYRLAFELAGTAAAVLLCVWFATTALRSENRNLKSELAKVKQDNDKLQEEYAATNKTVENLQAQLQDLQQSTLQTVKPEEGNSILIALNDGAGQITLDKAGNLTGLTTLAPVYQQMVKTSLLSERVQTPASIGNLTGRAGTLLGGSGEGVAFALLSPVGTNISPERPTFHWVAVKGATQYLVAVYDEDFNWVATSQPITATSWTTTTTLKRGATYFWQVSAMKDGNEIKSPVPPAPEAKFRIIEPAKANELAQLKKRSGNSHLAIGLIYAREGLLDDAEREFATLLQANPKSELARKLLNNVKALRRTRVN
jgi:hypothetical protein